MKIFFSYGHEGHNRPIVMRLKKDLEAAGHEVWMDLDEIKAGDDWRRKIVDGLADADWTVAFLSKHSVRDPGVWRDELNIALQEKGGGITTILLEDPAEVRPPAFVSHIQWLDMQDWAIREKGDRAAFDAWYKAKLDELLAVLASDHARTFAAEIEELQEMLQPVSQATGIKQLIEHFTGREWLKREVEQWRTSAFDSHLLWLSGGPGAGKSAFAAWLAHFRKVEVLSLNLCVWNDPDRRNSVRILETLAYQLAARLPDYRKRLLLRLRGMRAGTEARPGVDVEAFRKLLVEPLETTVDGGRAGHRVMVVIDGLDETVREPSNNLAKTLALEARKLPKWLALVVTSRPEEPIEQHFAAFKPFHIEADSAENMEDVRSYIEARLSPIDGLPRESIEPLVSRIAASSEGNFLYLTKYFEHATAEALRLDVPDNFPQGLVGLYAHWFERHFRKPEDYERYRPVLGVLAAAELPVPEAWLAQIFGWASIPERARWVEGLPSLFERRPKGIAPFHKTLRDWLIDPDKSKAAFVVDAADGSRRLAEGLWGEFVRWAASPEEVPLDPFCVSELPAQARRLAQPDMRRLAAAAAPESIFEGVRKTAEATAAAYRWADALAWWRLEVQVADATGDIASLYASYAHDEIGDIQVTIGNLAEALVSFRAGLAIRERLARSDEGNAGWQRDLSVSYDRIGDVQVAQGNLAEALVSFRAGLAIRERLARSDEGNAGWQRDVIVSCFKLAGAIPAEAESFFSRALEIANQLSESGRLAPVDAWIPGELARRLAALGGSPPGKAKSWWQRLRGR